VCYAGYIANGCVQYIKEEDGFPFLMVKSLNGFVQYKPNVGVVDKSAGDFQLFHACANALMGNTLLMGCVVLVTVFRLCIVISPLLLYRNTILSPDLSCMARRISKGTVICPLHEIFARFINSLQRVVLLIIDKGWNFTEPFLSKEFQKIFKKIITRNLMRREKG